MASNKPSVGAIYSMEMPNAQLVRQGIENFTAALPQIGRQRMYKFAKAISAYYAYSKTNPPKHGKYVRTFAMRKARKIMKTEFGYVFTMDPVSPKGSHYGVYVAGTLKPNSQARMHVGTWIPLIQAVQTEGAKLPAEVIKELGIELAKETAKANIK